MNDLAEPPRCVDAADGVPLSDPRGHRASPRSLNGRRAAPRQPARPGVPAPQNWQQAGAALMALGCRVVRNDWGAPQVFRGSRALDYQAAPAAIRQAWNTLSIDNPG